MNTYGMGCDDAEGRRFFRLFIQKLVCKIETYWTVYLDCRQVNDVDVHIFGPSDNWDGAVLVHLPLQNTRGYCRPGHLRVANFGPLGL